MKGLADTGFLVAFANRRDRHHAWAVSVASRISEPMLTCEPVLAETAFHLRNSEIVIRMVDEGLVTIAFEMKEHLARVGQLAERYADRNPDIADLCLICMSELFPRHTVVTVDRTDFRIYRRNQREAIPLLLPPGR